MKNILFSMILITFVGFSQTTNKAKSLLDKVSTQVKTYQNMAIDFSYSLQNMKENINQTNKGSVILKGNQYVLNFLGVIKLCDGKKVHTISKEDEEITISKIGSSEDENDTPAKMLTFFNKGFKYSIDIIQTVKGKKIQYVKLIPISSKDERKEVLVGIDTKTNLIYNTISTNKNGSRVTLTVNSFKSNQALPKNQFTFNASKYPNYYINNLD